jgi:hypothetical protein
VQQTDLTDGRCSPARVRTFVSASEQGAASQRHNEQRETSDEDDLHDGRDAGHDTCGNAA